MALYQGITMDKFKKMAMEKYLAEVIFDVIIPKFPANFVANFNTVREWHPPFSNYQTATTDELIQAAKFRNTYLAIIKLINFISKYDEWKILGALYGIASEQTRACKVTCYEQIAALHWSWAMIEYNKHYGELDEFLFDKVMDYIDVRLPTLQEKMKFSRIQSMRRQGIPVIDIANELWNSVQSLK